MAVSTFLCGKGGVGQGGWQMAGKGCPAKKHSKQSKKAQGQPAEVRGEALPGLHSTCPPLWFVAL